MQLQLNGNPPNIEKIRAVFPLTGKEIFAWGNTIYNPGGGPIPPWLAAHEKIHMLQQGDDIEGWWDRYLVDAEWRFKQELEAHQEEYRVFCVLNKDRNTRIRYKNMLAARLASSMYGNMVTKKEALKWI